MEFAFKSRVCWIDVGVFLISRRFFNQNIMLCHFCTFSSLLQFSPQMNPICSSSSTHNYYRWEFWQQTTVWQFKVLPHQWRGCWKLFFPPLKNVCVFLSGLWPGSCHFLPLWPEEYPGGSWLRSVSSGVSNKQTAGDRGPAPQQQSGRGHAGCHADQAPETPHHPEARLALSVWLEEMGTEFQTCWSK